MPEPGRELVDPVAGGTHGSLGRYSLGVSATEASQIFDHEGNLYDELTLIQQDASTVVARRRSGQIATYRVRERRAA